MNSVEDSELQTKLEEAEARATKVCVYVRERERGREGKDGERKREREGGKDGDRKGEREGGRDSSVCAVHVLSLGGCILSQEASYIVYLCVCGCTHVQSAYIHDACIHVSA